MPKKSSSSSKSKSKMASIAEETGPGIHTSCSSTAEATTINPSTPRPNSRSAVVDMEEGISITVTKSASGRRLQQCQGQIQGQTSQNGCHHSQNATACSTGTNTSASTSAPSIYAYIPRWAPIVPRVCGFGIGVPRNLAMNPPSPSPPAAKNTKPRYTAASAILKSPKYTGIQVVDDDHEGRIWDMAPLELIQGQFQFFGPWM